ncbi:MAG TPA: ATP-binding protein [Magnetospirillaceae bacterium]|jgi:signal transduction histidine kinase
MPKTTTSLQRVRRSRAIVVAVTIAAIALFCGVSWHNYDRLRAEQVADITGDADRALLAIDDHMTQLIDYSDSRLRSLRNFYIEHGNGPAFRAYVNETRMNDAQAFVGDVAVADAQGQAVFLLSTPGVPQGDVSDRAYYKVLSTTSEDRLIIDWTRKGRATSQYQFRVVRPIRVNNRFEGVVLITLRPEAIVNLFQQFGLGQRSTISALQTDEHRYIAHLPVGDASYYDKLFDGLELWAQLRQTPHGVYHHASPLDGVPRYYAYQKSSLYPIVIVIGVADADIDAGLADTRRDVEFQALLLTFGAIIICALVLRLIGVEDRLRRSNANLIHAQRMGKIGSVEVDLVTMKPTWSDELYRIYDRDRALGPANLEEFLAYLHPDDRATVTEMRDQHTAGDVRGPNEYRIVLRDGSIRWVHREVEVVRDESGRPIKLVAAEQDITEQKRLDQAKDAFVSTVSHELRTPLTSIRGALGLIASGAAGALPDKTLKLFEIAHRNSERLSRLVNDLLDIQRISAGHMTYHLADIVLAKVLTDTIETIRPFAKERNIDIAFNTTCPDAMVHADAARIAQVMDNLLSNAIKFSPPDQLVAVTLVRRSHRLRITVEDHGPGIPESFRPRIFQLFSQADSSDTRKIGGSGLGLSIVRSIVEQHGGEVSFDSDPTHGTRFHVDLDEINQPKLLLTPQPAKPQPVGATEAGPVL